MRMDLPQILGFSIDSPFGGGYSVPNARPPKATRPRNSDPAQDNLFARARFGRGADPVCAALEANSRN
jgi:hypothetical protein